MEQKITDGWRGQQSLLKGRGWHFEFETELSSDCVSSRAILSGICAEAFPSSKEVESTGECVIVQVLQYRVLGIAWFCHHHENIESLVRGKGNVSSQNKNRWYQYLCFCLACPWSSSLPSHGWSQIGPELI